MEIQSPWFAGRVRSVRSVGAPITKINIFFSDKAHFHLNGYVNQQNYRYWSSENPKEKHETQLHSLKVTVWYAIHAQDIIGRYFFENGRGRSVTVDSDRYVDMLNNFFEPALQELMDTIGTLGFSKTPSLIGIRIGDSHYYISLKALT